MNKRPISLITGATGLAGRALSKRLLEKGHELRILVLEDDPLLADFVENCPDINSVEVCKGDITNYESIVPYFNNVSCVYHVAALVTGAHPKSVYEKVNVLGTKNVLEAVINANVPRLIAVATADVYGMPNGEVFTDTSEYRYWQDFYADSKIDAAKMVKQYVKERGVNATIIHPGWVYGPGDQNLIPAIVEMLQSGWVVTWGAMKMSKLDMIHVDDLANAMIMAASDAQTIGKDIIVSDNSEEITFPMLVELVAKQLKCSYRTIHLPYWLMMAIAKTSKLLKKIGVVEDVLLSPTDVRGFGLIFSFAPRAAKAMGWQRKVDTRKAFSDCAEQAKL